MLTVHKYLMPMPGAVQIMALPAGWKVARVDWQGLGLYLWATVETDADLQRWGFTTVGTGDAVPPDAVHCGTVMDANLVWHVFAYPDHD